MVKNPDNTDEPTPDNTDEPTPDAPTLGESTEYETDEERAQDVPEATSEESTEYESEYETDEERAEDVPDATFGVYKDDGSLNPAYGDPLEIQDRVDAHKEELASDSEDAEPDPNPAEVTPYEEDTEAHAVYAAENIINQPPPTEPGIPAVSEPLDDEEVDAGVEGDEAMRQPIVAEDAPGEEIDPEGAPAEGTDPEGAPAEETFTGQVTGEVTGTITTDETPDDEASADSPYDPGDYTVDEVKSHVEAFPDSVETVLAAEEAGRNRSTLVSWLESFNG
jgi:hypothetical protein